MWKYILLCFLIVKCVNLTDVTYYEILGVSKQASSQEIRQAYKKLAIKFHPDKNPDKKIQEKFIKITEAYETLKDPDKRHMYDVHGSYPSYTRRYDHKSQTEYNNLYYNGLYHDDPFVDTLSGGGFYNYLQEGFHFINFYSPFCPPCQSLSDHWKKLAEVYKGIIKVGAVNCKYYNSFCYNSMRIGSYPSLLFYPNGKHGSYMYYRGDRTFDALNQYVLSFLRSQVHVPVISQIRGTERPMAYVLGSNRIEKDALTRVAYHLNGLVTLAIVEDDGLRSKLTSNEYATVVFKFRGTTKEIESTEEKELLDDIVGTLPRVAMIDPDKLKEIRGQLRNGDDTPWVLYLSTADHDRLLLHQMRISNTDMQFGEIDCDKWGELCATLQVESPPSWAVLKPGGGYQLVPPSVDLRTYARAAAGATNLHSLGAADAARILDGDVGAWVLLVVPHALPWTQLLHAFTRVAARYTGSTDISFGIWVCTVSTDASCRRLVSEAGVVAAGGGKTHAYSGRVEDLDEWVDLLAEDLELSEQQVLEIMDASREHSWLVAFLPAPAHCGRLCDTLAHEWRRVAKKLRPLEFVRVGILQCTVSTNGLCRNVRAPTARLYPYASGQFYTANLRDINQAPYILEWALGLLDDSLLQLHWHSFSKLVVSEDLNPGRRKPWLVYFHSPRCFRCYEMFADFAIAGILLNNAVNLGKVNCMNERSLCQHEQITSYPSLRLYLARNHRNRFSSVVTVPVREYTSILDTIKPHLQEYGDNLGVELGVGSYHVHDEF